MTAPDPRTDLGTQAIVAGDPLKWTITVQVNGTGVDLTTIGSAWAGDLRQSVGSSPEIALVIDATNAATGVLVLSLTGTTTATMCPGGASTHWYFDLQATGGAVTPQTPFKGGLVVYKGIV